MFSTVRAGPITKASRGADFLAEPQRQPESRSKTCFRRDSAGPEGPFADSKLRPHARAAKLESRRSLPL